jgi:hypothetical protein
MKTKTFRTVNDVREEKRLAEALADEQNTARVRIELDRQNYITARLREYPQIGVLSSGKFYAFISGQYIESKFLSSVIDAINDAA